jgi:trk system potassium uptake protein TrkA
MHGAEVIAVDINREEVELLRDQVSLAVRLDSTDELALKAQGIDKVDVAVVGMGQAGFEAAILTVAILRQMGVPQVYARAETPTAGRVFLQVGATEVIYPELESAQRWGFKLIAPQITDKIDVAPGHSLARVPAPFSFAGKTLLELGLRQKYNVNLIMIKRSDTAADHPGDMLAAKPGSIIYKDDLLLFVGTDVDLAKLPQE